jgi:hypothetical protein
MKKKKIKSGLKISIPIPTKWGYAEVIISSCDDRARDWCYEWFNKLVENSRPRGFSEFDLHFLKSNLEKNNKK